MIVISKDTGGKGGTVNYISRSRRSRRSRARLVFLNKTTPRVEFKCNSLLKFSRMLLYSVLVVPLRVVTILGGDTSVYCI